MVHLQQSSSPPPGRRRLKDTPGSSQRQLCRESANRTYGAPRDRHVYRMNVAELRAFDGGRNHGGGQRRGSWYQQEGAPCGVINAHGARVTLFDDCRLRRPKYASCLVATRSPAAMGGLALHRPNSRRARRPYLTLTSPFVSL